MKNIVSIALISLGLAACEAPTYDAESSPVSQNAIRDANTIPELLFLGARQLNGDELRSELVDQTLVADGWAWDINSDGTASTRADDGSWTLASTWQISGNQYCDMTASENTASCSDVYELGGIYRFSIPDAPGFLSGWAVTVR